MKSGNRVKGFQASGWDGVSPELLGVEHLLCAGAGAPAVFWLHMAAGLQHKLVKHAHGVGKSRKARNDIEDTILSEGATD